MSRKRYSLFFFLLLSLQGFSQTNDSLLASRLTITTSLFSYLPSPDLNVIKYNIGSEIFLKKRISFYVNVALLKSYRPPSTWLSVSSRSTKGIKTELEGRYYLNKHKIFQPAILFFWPHAFQFKSVAAENTGYYIAANTFFQQTRTIRSEFAHANNSATLIYYLNDYTVERNMLDLNLRIGYQCIRKCGLTIDFAIGFGAQFISSFSENKLVPNNDSDLYSNKNFDNGTGFAPSVVYQLRLGWAWGI
jgi:hypothetical protein